MHCWIRWFWISIVFCHVDCVPENAFHAGRDPSDPGTVSVSNCCYLLIGFQHVASSFIHEAYQSVQAHQYENATCVSRRTPNKLHQSCLLDISYLSQKCKYKSFVQTKNIHTFKSIVNQSRLWTHYGTGTHVQKKSNNTFGWIKLTLL